jgi:NADH-quinone oxidoreductase subunit C
MHELKEKFPAAVEEIASRLGEVTVVIRPESLLPVCQFLQREKGFDYLADLTGIDLGPMQAPRFEVLYHLYSLKTYQRLRLKVRTAAAVDSVTSLWQGADWFEREVYDLIGVGFAGHPNLTRIYMPETFAGHPLRKDYPLRGE